MDNLNIEKYLVYQFDKTGLTPLHWAVNKSSKQMCHLLLKNKSQINKLDHFGRTPLYIATKKGDIGMIKLLLSFKAIPNIKSTKTSISCINLCKENIKNLTVNIDLKSAIIPKIFA